MPAGGPLTIALALVALTGDARADDADTSPEAAPPRSVAVFASHHSRLAEELRHELEASAFRVTLIETTAAHDLVENPPRPEVPLAVSIAPGDSQVRAFVRDGASVRESFTRTIDGADRVARRRVCLELVEDLRTLGNGETPATAGVASRPNHPPPPVAAVAAESPVMSSLSSPVIPRRPWSLGVATTLNVDSTGHRPTSDVQLLWQLPLNQRLSIVARGSWPVVASQFAVDDKAIRILAFAAGAAVQYDFSSSQAQWRPYAGAIAGSRLLLTETLWRAAPTSRVTATPAVLVGAQAGVRCRLSRGVRVFSELEATKGWLAPAVSDRWSYEEAAAGAASLLASVGVLFEY